MTAQEISIEPQTYLDLLAGDIRSGRISEAEGRRLWGAYCTARRRAGCPVVGGSREKNRPA